ncbi:MAG TPA: hypothetical protein P5549_07060, partial [Syntrophomonas sp.]|nr:hypothetical protein [Syntrophomonas sp.]
GRFLPCFLPPESKARTVPDLRDLRQINAAVCNIRITITTASARVILRSGSAIPWLPTINFCFMQ